MKRAASVLRVSTISRRCSSSDGVGIRPGMRGAGVAARDGVDARAALAEVWRRMPASGSAAPRRATPTHRTFEDAGEVAALQLRAGEGRALHEVDEAEAVVAADGQAALEERHVVALALEAHVDHLGVHEPRLGGRNEGGREGGGRGGDG